MTTINRRALMSRGASILATAASFVIVPKVLLAETSKATIGTAAMDSGHHTNEAMDRCIQLCQDCHALCTRTIRHCLDLGGRHAGPEHIRLLIDCAQMCQVNVDYMLRGSVLHERVCGICAEACKLCGENCAQIAGDDLMLKQCVDLCRRCGESCERMASKVAAEPA